MDIWERLTPPLFRARTCSIVLSFCRGVELENDLICSCKLLARLPSCKPNFLLLEAHAVSFLPAIRNDTAGLEL